MRSEDQFGMISLVSMVPVALIFAIWALPSSGPVNATVAVNSAQMPVRVEPAAITATSAPATSAAPEPAGVPVTATLAVAPQVPEPKREPSSEPVPEPAPVVANIISKVEPPARKPRVAIKRTRAAARAAEALESAKPTDCAGVPFQCRKWNDEWTLSSEKKKIRSSTPKPRRRTPWFNNAPLATEGTREHVVTLEN